MMCTIIQLSAPISHTKLSTELYIELSFASAFPLVKSVQSALQFVS